MPSPRGRSHSTLTDTAALVVAELKKLPGIKMIAPGIIDGKRGSNSRNITVVYTTAGMELIISGQGVQKVSIHTTVDPHTIATKLKSSKRLALFTWNSRERKPGI